MLNDVFILTQIKEGNIKAFETLFRQYYTPLRLYAASITGEPDVAEEIVEEVGTSCLIELIEGVLWIGFHDFITILTEVNLLLITIYIGIQMNTSFIKVTVLTEHISTSFLSELGKIFIENNLGQKRSNL